MLSNDSVYCCCQLESLSRGYDERRGKRTRTDQLQLVLLLLVQEEEEEGEEEEDASE